MEDAVYIGDIKKGQLESLHLGMGCNRTASDELRKETVREVIRGSWNHLMELNLGRNGFGSEGTRILVGVNMPNLHVLWISRPTLRQTRTILTTVESSGYLDRNGNN